MKIVTIVGARPQFIKAAPVSLAIRQAGHQEILVHTGQHYDSNMSDVFFDELQIPPPDINLAVGSGNHGAQTAAMLAGIEETLLRELPDWLLIYGDTNSTLAGALAASKIHIPIAHIESGLRSFNWRMPEEVNRVLADRLSQLLFCPSQTAVDHLRREGIVDGVYLVGDIMYDAVLKFSKIATEKSSILTILRLQPQQYYLATVHRAENTDDRQKMDDIIKAFGQLDLPVILPIHPRTRNKLAQYGYDLNNLKNIRSIDPLGYLDMLQLQSQAQSILTDSGGVQKEAYWLKVPCVTLREETEWVETVTAKANILVGSDRDKILNAVNFYRSSSTDYSAVNLYGDGRATIAIIERLTRPSKSV
jgi:UDP-GlcNAc3NAcA epimerase